MAAITVLAVAFALGAWWDVAESPHGVEGGPSYGDALAQTLHDLDDVARHTVGNFGSLDTLPPTWRTCSGASSRSGWSSLPPSTARGAAGGAAALPRVAGGVTLVVSVVQLRTGYGAQGRHVLPALVLVPLYAGEVLRSPPSACCPQWPAWCGRSGRPWRGSPARAAARSAPRARGGSSATRTRRRRSAGRHGARSPRSASCSRSPAT